MCQCSVEQVSGWGVLLFLVLGAGLMAVVLTWLIQLGEGLEERRGLWWALKYSFAGMKDVFMDYIIGSRR